jgi:hypothetical protein
MARFKHWAGRLGSVISDVPLPHMPPGSQLVSLKEAMQTMQVGRSTWKYGWAWRGP